MPPSREKMPALLSGTIALVQAMTAVSFKPLANGLGFGGGGGAGVSLDRRRHGRTVGSDGAIVVDGAAAARTNRS